MQPFSKKFQQTSGNQKNDIDQNLQSILLIDQKLLKRASSNSYLKQMVRRSNIQGQEDLKTAANFVISFKDEPSVQKELQQFWCIVALNQGILHQQRSFLGCCQSNRATGFDRSNLKLYQLFISLGKKQLRFQSLESSKRYFVVNIDTVQTHISNDQTHNQIRLAVEGKFTLDFYFTTDTLPFGVRLNHSRQEAQKICIDIYKHTDLVIRKSIKESKGIRYGLRSSQLPDQDFYQVIVDLTKHRYATQQQFMKYSQTGDVLLFRDNHTSAKVQRFFTNSQCDHIGLVYKHSKYGLCIFQSNSDTGVTLTLWSQLIREKWFDSIEGIYWRRLNMQNKPQGFQDKIDEFIKHNLHKQYGISVGKLFTWKEIIYLDEESRTYFCSQLIAALYKYLQILEPNKPSSTYLPKHFTDKGSLNMINNTALEAERRLVFNQKLLKENYQFYR